MARNIKKPKVIREKDLKEDAGPVEIDLDAALKQKEDLQALEALKAEQKYQAVVKAMENAAASAASSSANKPRVISFNTWFQKASSKNPKIKLSYKEAIESHCKAIGINQQATEEEFEAALVHFGL